MTDHNAPTELSTSNGPPAGDREPEMENRGFSSPLAVLVPNLEERYELGGVLGRGGMGEVRLARDVRIDRDVAVKLMRPEQRDDNTIARFFREARVQGRLDHPAIPPVHDLGIDRNGNPYFVMKRLAGTTLAEVLARVEHDSAIRERWPRRLLLARHVDVCLAVELAHTRGVIHRDLKPANIMLGDFGEVYVLDWGLARVLEPKMERGATDRPSQPIMGLPGDSDAGRTVAGALLGTPGYMAPEQIRGATVETRSDVYALGCILYEILVGKPAWPNSVDALAVALDAACLRPSERFPELSVPPELDDLCARATAADLALRPSARAVADAIQAYLDGDRDLGRRRELANQHAAVAREALETPGDAARARAMNEAGRAIVLDADNLAAQSVLVHLMLETSDVIPEEARIAADAERLTILHSSTRWLARGYSIVFAMLCVMFLLVFPIRHLAPILAMLGSTGLADLSLWYAVRRRIPLQSPWFLVTIWLNAATLLAGALVLGPLLMIPIFLITTLAAAFSQLLGFRPIAIVIPYVLSFGVPLGLEWVGVLPSTYHVEHHALLLTPWTLDLTPTATLVMVLTGIVSQAVVICSLMLNQTRVQHSARARQHTQSWHLRQLLPRR